MRYSLIPEECAKVEIKVRNYRETISKADAMQADLQDLIGNDSFRYSFLTNRFQSKGPLR